MKLEDMDADNLDWPYITSCIRSKYKPLSKVAIEIGCDAGTLRRINTGYTPEPKFLTGAKLLDLYLDYCEGE